MSIDVDLLAKLQTLTTAPVQLNYASTDRPQPRVWLQRRNDNRPLNLAGTETLIRETFFDVEVGALDPDVGAAIAEQLTAEWTASPAGMNGFRGQMGGTRVLGCFVEDVGDDYQPRELELDDGYHVTAFSLRLLS